MRAVGDGSLESRQVWSFRRFKMADRIRSLLGHVTQGKAPALLKQTATELHQLTLDHDLEPGLIAEAARRLWNAVQPQRNQPEALQGEAQVCSLQKSSIFIPCLRFAVKGIALRLMFSDGIGENKHLVRQQLLLASRLVQDLLEAHNLDEAKTTLQLAERAYAAMKDDVAEHDRELKAVAEFLCAKVTCLQAQDLGQEAVQTYSELVTVVDQAPNEVIVFVVAFNRAIFTQVVDIAEPRCQASS